MPREISLQLQAMQLYVTPHLQTMETPLQTMQLDHLTSADNVIKSPHSCKKVQLDHLQTMQLDHPTPVNSVVRLTNKTMELDHQVPVNNAVISSNTCRQCS